MPNKNYQAGVRFEREYKKAWEEANWTVLRTAGSHGLFDLIAIKPGERVWLIQCKITSSKSTMARLLSNFTAGPPMEPSREYIQCMAVKLKGTSYIEDACVYG